MSYKIDVSLTVETMLSIAQEFESKARNIRRLATELQKTEDLSLAGEAVNECINFSNIRVDLLATRPIRELTEKCHDLRKDNV